MADMVIRHGIRHTGRDGGDVISLCVDVGGLVEDEPHHTVVVSAHCGRRFIADKGSVREWAAHVVFEKARKWCRGGYGMFRRTVVKSCRSRLAQP